MEHKPVTPRDLDLALKFERGFHAAIEQARATGVGYVRIKHVPAVALGSNETFEVDAPAPEFIIVTTPTL